MTELLPVLTSILQICFYWLVLELITSFSDVLLALLLI